MAKKWNKVIARIEALEDALARLMGGSRKSRKTKKAKSKGGKAKPARAKAAPAKRAKTKRAQTNRAKTKAAGARPAASRSGAKAPRRSRKPRAAKSLPMMPEVPVATL